MQRRAAHDLVATSSAKFIPDEKRAIDHQMENATEKHQKTTEHDRSGRHCHAAVEEERALALCSMRVLVRDLSGSIRRSSSINW
jgi:hypothetical protein